MGGDTGGRQQPGTAAELGANVAIAKAGGLLHDIGKAIDHEIEGTHAQIGADYAKRYGVGSKIVNCIPNK